MAYESGNLVKESFIADADLSAKQYYFVMAASTAGKVQLATGASSPAPIGVLQNKPKAGSEATVAISGITKVIGNGATAITYRDYLTSGSNGQAVVAGSAMHGQALEALASGSGVAITMLLMPYHADTVDNTP